MGQYGDILNVEVVNGDEPMVLITFRRKEEADQVLGTCDSSCDRNAGV